MLQATQLSELHERGNTVDMRALKEDSNIIILSPCASRDCCSKSEWQPKDFVFKKVKKKKKNQSTQSKL